MQKVLKIKITLLIIGNIYFNKNILTMETKTTQINQLPSKTIAEKILIEESDDESDSENGATINPPKIQISQTFQFQPKFQMDLNSKEIVSCVNVLLSEESENEEDNKENTIKPMNRHYNQENIVKKNTNQNKLYYEIKKIINSYEENNGVKNSDEDEIEIEEYNSIYSDNDGDDELSKYKITHQGSYHPKKSKFLEYKIGLQRSYSYDYKDNQQSENNENKSVSFNMFLQNIELEDMKELLNLLNNL